MWLGGLRCLGRWGLIQEWVYWWLVGQRWGKLAFGGAVVQRDEERALCGRGGVSWEDKCFH